MTPTTSVGTPSKLTDRPRMLASRAEAAHPEPVRQNRDRRRTRDAFFFGEPAAHRRRDAQNWRERWRRASTT